MVTLHKGNFFKYIDIEGGKKSLKRRTFKFSVPSVTNDPFECYGGLIADDQRDIFEQLIKDDIRTNKRVEKLKKIVDQNQLENEITKIVNGSMPEKITLFNKVRDIFSIASFSRRNDIHLMWSYYAQNHQGICIGYDMQNSKFNKGIWFLKINYTRKIIPISFEPQKEHSHLLHWVTTKSYDWVHEQEVRLVDLNVKRNMKNVFFEQYEKELVKKITFGINTPIKEINDIIEIVKKTYPNQQIEYTKMVVGDKQFTMKEVPYVTPQKSYLRSAALKYSNLLFKPKIPFVFSYCRLFILRKISVSLDNLLLFLRRLS
jgi:hypothetical protein